MLLFVVSLQCEKYVQPFNLLVMLKSMFALEVFLAAGKRGECSYLRSDVRYEWSFNAWKFSSRERAQEFADCFDMFGVHTRVFGSVVCTLVWRESMLREECRPWRESMINGGCCLPF